MRKILLGLLPVLLLVASSVFALSQLPPPPIFPDVPWGKYYTGAVENLYNLGIMSGYKNGLFGPNHKITRAQTAVVLDSYHQKIIEPLMQQVVRLHQGGRMSFTGKSFDEYLDSMRAYELSYSMGDLAGEPKYADSFAEQIKLQFAIASAEIDDPYFDRVPEDFEVVYTHGDAFKIIAQEGSLDKISSWFYIWEDDGDPYVGVYGFFYDDVKRIVDEAKASTRWKTL